MSLEFRVPLLNLANIQAKMDSLQKFLSISVTNNILLSEEQIGMAAEDPTVRTRKSSSWMRWSYYRSTTISARYAERDSSETQIFRCTCEPVQDAGGVGEAREMRRRMRARQEHPVLVPFRQLLEEQNTQEIPPSEIRNLHQESLPAEPLPQDVLLQSLQQEGLLCFGGFEEPR
nr:protein SENSITIVE TO PROTON RHIZOTOXICITY 1-like [Ipomoea batatas]